MRARGLLILAVLAIASASRAGTWPICFEDNGAPTPQAFQAFREAGRSVRAAGMFGARVVLMVPTQLAGSEDLLTARLELIRAGVGPGGLETVAAEGSTCISVSVQKVDPQRNPPGLWHLSPIYGFPSGSDAIERPSARRTIRIAAALYHRERTRIRLAGHTDTVGAAEENMELSRRRAESVARALTREGVRWEDIEIEAHGEEQLANTTPDETPEPLNRRVQIDMRWPSAIPD